MQKNQNCWETLRNGRVECLENPPDGYYGFVYLITNEMNGKIYVGKKAFTHRKKTALSKRARKNTRKRVVVKAANSGWMNYFGSSKELLADLKIFGKDNFRRTVLYFAKNKSELSYYEALFQFKYNVMYTPSYNNWISVTVRKNNL